MTYQAVEESFESGRPIHFYRFTLGDTIWRYTSADEDITAGGFAWKALPIEDSGVSQTGESSSDTLSITASWKIGPAQVYMSTPPSEPIIVERLGKHEGIDTLIVNYVGEVLQVNFPTPGQVVISAHTLSATMRRAGLRLGWQRTCPYALYDPTTCKVDPADFAVSAKVEAVDGFQITLSGLQAGVDYQGGYYEWSHPVRGIQRTAIDQFDNTGVIPPTVFETVSFAIPGTYNINVPVGTTSYSYSMSGAGGGGSGGTHGYSMQGESYETQYPGVEGKAGGRGQTRTGTKLSPTVGATLTLVIGAGGAGGGVGVLADSVPGLPGSSGQTTTLNGDGLSVTALAGGGATASTAGTNAGTGAAGGAGGAAGFGSPNAVYNPPAGPGGAGANGSASLTFATSNDAINVGTIQAFGDTSEIHPGMIIAVYPGCQRTMVACETFSNLDNYGGFPSMPGKSPFDGTPFF